MPRSRLSVTFFQPTVNAPELSCRQILIVDDDEDVRDAVADVLVDEGYGVTGVSSGREALQHLQDHMLPSLILLDMMMPEMDGWLLRQELKKSPELASIPIVILSGHGDVRDAALALGAVDYLRKPLRIDSLLEIAERYCCPVFLN